MAGTKDLLTLIVQFSPLISIQVDEKTWVSSLIQLLYSVFGNSSMQYLKIYCLVSL